MKFENVKNESESSYYMDKLLFRRQYFLSPKDLNCPYNFCQKRIGKDHILYYHSDLMLTSVANDVKTIVLLGDIYNYKDPKAGNHEILTSLLGKDFSIFVKNTFDFAGRFVIIFCDQNGIKLFTDAVAQRKVFHTSYRSQVYCSSNPHLLANLLDYKRTSNDCWLQYYSSEEFRKKFNSNIGYFTLYDEIKQLLPNHYLDIHKNIVNRFWPSQTIEKIDDDEIVRISARMIKGFLAAAAYRHPLMIPITSGGDSRIILAATKDLRKNVFYYINFMKEIDNKPDILVPQKLLIKYHREFNILYPDSHKIDDNFKKIFFLNNPLPNDVFLPVIYNYYLNYSNMVNIPGGVIPIIKSLFNSNESNVTGSLLAKLYKVDRFTCANSFYDDWLDEYNQLCKDKGINLFDLLYWEERTCNWAGQIVQDKDIAQEEFIPFNSHRLIVTMLNYTRDKRRKPRYELHYKLVKDLWPELLEIPFNPSMKNTIKRILLSTGTYNMINNIRKRLLRILL